MIRPVLLSASIVGLLAGHFLGYLVAVPNEFSRHSVLASSGHAYLSAALVFGLLAAIVTLAGSAWLGYRKRHQGLGAVAARLALIQMSSYVVMELAERWIAGGSFERFSSLLGLGLLAQAVVAVVAAAVIVFFARVGDQLRRLMSTPKRRVPSRLGRPFQITPAIRSQVPAFRAVRGPPLPQTI